jgi:N-succinyl-L-ornithine transcarbamylase
MNHFLSVNDVTSIDDLVIAGLNAKKTPFSDQHLGQNKTIGLLFFNQSFRTRISTQKAAENLGLKVISLNVGSDSWGLEMEDGVLMDGTKAEHVKEAAAVIGRFCDIVGIRAFAGLEDRVSDYQEQVFKQFQKYAGVPIVNLESATRHPLQSLADCITIAEFKKVERPKVVLTWLPHIKPLPQAVANSFAEWMNKSNVEFVITHPKGYELSPEFSGNAPVIYDQQEALEGAHFVYGKNWSSYHQYGKILTEGREWVINEEKMDLTDNGYFMHCLPVRRNLKVTDGVIDGPQSLVIEQAANREWSAQAVLREILTTSF